MTVPPIALGCFINWYLFFFIESVPRRQEDEDVDGRSTRRKQAKVLNISRHKYFSGGGGGYWGSGVLVISHAVPQQ